MAESTTRPSPPAEVPFLDGGGRLHLYLLALTILFCWPILLSPFHPPVAHPASDVGNTQWNLWWVSQVLLGHAPGGATLMESPLLFHPLGANLAYTTVEWSYAVLLLPVRLLLGGWAQQVAALALATYLTGWFTWLAARQAGAAWIGAAAATLAITLHPYRLVEAQHLNVFSTQFFPLAMYLFLRLLANPGSGRLGAGLGVTAALCLATSVFHTLGCAILAAAMAVAGGWRFRQRPEELRRLLLRGLLAALILAPVAAWFVLHWSRAPAPVEFPLEARTRHSADPWQFLLHPRLRLPLTGMEAEPVTFGEGNRAMTWFLPGYLLGALGLWGAWRNFRRGAAVPAVLAIIYAVLSLGPRLKLGLPAEPNPEASTIPLPGALLTFLPGLGTLRTSQHFGFLATICLALAAAPMVDALAGRLAERLPVRRLPLLLLALVLVETYIRPIPSFPDRLDAVSGALARVAAPGEALVPLPQAHYQTRALFMYHQTIHGLPIVGGYLSRDPMDFEEWRAERRWLVELEELGNGAIAELSEEAWANFLADIDAHGIAWFAFLTPAGREDRRHRVYPEELSRHLDVELVFRDDFEAVMALRPGE